MTRPTAAIRPVSGFGLTLALLASVLLAAPDPAAAFDEMSIRPADEAPVELLRPAPGEVLTGGRETTFEWRARRDLAAEGIFEWEAFLSFDGGRTWPVRATPHLDTSIAAFSSTLPMVASDDVRIMLRFGDERREVGYVLPLVLRSVAGPGARTGPWSTEPTLELGEAAHPGVPGVVFWVEGARDGRRIVTRGSALRPLTASRPGSAGGPWCPVLAPTHQREIDLAVGVVNRCRSERRDPAPPIRRTALHALPLLLLVCRRNE